MEFVIYFDCTISCWQTDSLAGELIKIGLHVVAQTAKRNTRTEQQK